MSKQSLKRWLDARDAYLGHGFPYIQDRSKRRPRRRRRTGSSRTTLDGRSRSIFTIDSDRFSARERMSAGKQRRLSRNKLISQSAADLRRSGLLECLRAFVRSPIRSLRRRRRRPPLRTQGQLLRTPLIYDHFDDKCIGTEVAPRTAHRSHGERRDQSVQADLARPQLKLHHEHDRSMVDGERRQRTRSVRRHVEYSDKTTETDFILNFIHGEKEKGGGGEEEKETDDDKAIRSAAGGGAAREEKIGSSNVERDQSLAMSKSEQHSKNKYEAARSINGSNRVVPVAADQLDKAGSNKVRDTNDHCNGSRSTIVTTSDSTASVHEQLLR